MRGNFQLHPEDGAAVLKAIEARIPRDTPLRGWDKAAAMALVELSRSSAGSGRSAPATTVLVSVTEDALIGAPGAEAVASLDSGGLVGATTARRLSCDAAVQAVTKDASGRILGIGRTSRTVPPWLRRVVLERDGGRCTFPSCDRDRYLECHHIVPWSEGGPTEAPNLLTTCWEHHGLFHEDGWSVRGEAGPHIMWLRPDGSPFEPRVRVVLDTS